MVLTLIRWIRMEINYNPFSSRGQKAQSVNRFCIRIIKGQTHYYATIDRFLLHYISVGIAASPLTRPQKYQQQQK